MRVIQAAMSDPDCSGVIICGAAGVGKSRIAREALSSLASKGFETRWAVGTSSARELPLGAFASWAPSAAAETLQLVRGIIDSLVSASPGTTAVAGVDDAHLLDDLSTFVLQQIIERRAAKVLLTLRDGEPIPAGIEEVRKDERLERLDLQPLSRDETATLLSAALRGPVDPDAANRLWMLTRGNVLYLRNIVEHETSDGRLAQRHAYWRWTGDPVVPPSLAELIESRIGTLPSTVADVIDVLAVGEPIGLASLTRITDLVAVEEADTRGLITLGQGEDGAEVRVAHPLYGEVRRARAAPTRLRRLRGLVATELAAADDRDDVRVVVRRATLSLDSDLKPDPDLFLRAAQGAVSLGDLRLADRLADAAIRAGGGTEASLVRFGVLSWLSRGDDADALLADIPATEVTGTDWGRIVFFRAVNRLITLADPAGAKKFIDDASQGVPPEARRCIDAFLTVYWAAMGNATAAIESSKSFVLDELPDVISTAVAWAIAVASGEAGRPTEAVAAANKAYGVMTRSPDAAHMRYVIADGHIGALLLAGRISEALGMAERLRKLAADHPGMEPLYSMALAGRAALGAGRLHAARSLLSQAVEALSASGECNGWGYRYQLPRTTALAMSGLSVEAAAALVALEKWRHPSRGHLDCERGLVHAWVAAAQGAVIEAVRMVLSAAETARANGQTASEVMCLQTATQFGDRSCAARLRELEAIVEGPRVGVVARFAAALQAGDEAELATASEEFEQMGDLVAALDAAAHAAFAYRRKDLRGTALTYSTRAEALAQQCGGAGTPALREASEPLPLTSREREIVMLLRAGLSSPAIAQRLTLSPRTVEGHIYRAMVKTGAASREDLAALLPGHKRRSHD
jgi:DNA-binding CsgD family transcriptional regulator